MATEARRATLEILLSARNASAPAFAAIQSSLTKIRSIGGEAFAAVGRFAGSARTQLLGVLAAVGGIQKLLLEPAAFEESLVRITVASKVLENDIDRIRTAIEELAVSTGRRREELAAAFEVAGKRARSYEEALRLVTTANKLATLTNTPVKDSVVELTAVMEAFGISLERVDEVAAKVFEATKRLPDTAGELVGELAKVGPAARDAGLGLEQVLAAIVAMEREGLRAQRALRGGGARVIETATENSASFRRELQTITETSVPEFEQAFERVDRTLNSLIDGFKELVKVAALAFARPQFADIEKALDGSAKHIDRIRIVAEIAGLEFAKWRAHLTGVIAIASALFQSFQTGLLTIKVALQGVAGLLSALFLRAEQGVLEFRKFVIDQISSLFADEIARIIEKATKDIPLLSMILGTITRSALPVVGIDTSELTASIEQVKNEIIELDKIIAEDLEKSFDDLGESAEKTRAAFLGIGAAFTTGGKRARDLEKQIAGLRRELEDTGDAAKETGEALAAPVRPAGLHAAAAFDFSGQFGAPRRAVEDDHQGALSRFPAMEMTESIDAAYAEQRRLAEDHADRLADIARSTQDSVQASFVGVFDGFIQGTLSAKDALADFGRNMLSMLNQLIANRAFEAIFGVSGQPGRGSSLFGGIVSAIFSGKGNVLPGSFEPLKAFAGGGIATRPTIGLIAEAGMNEAVVPLPDGRRIPVALRGGGRGHQTTNIYISAMDGPSVMRVLQSYDGRRGIEAVNRTLAATRPDFRGRRR